MITCFIRRDDAGGSITRGPDRMHDRIPAAYYVRHVLDCWSAALRVWLTFGAWLWGGAGALIGLVVGAVEREIVQGDHSLLALTGFGALTGAIGVLLAMLGVGAMLGAVAAREDWKVERMMDRAEEGR
jgi:hypothetical protein